MAHHPLDRKKMPKNEKKERLARRRRPAMFRPLLKWLIVLEHNLHVVFSVAPNKAHGHVPATSSSNCNCNNCCCSNCNCGRSSNNLKYFVAVAATTLSGETTFFLFSGTTLRASY